MSGSAPPKPPPGGSQQGSVGYKFTQDEFPEYPATEYAPAVVDAPFQNDDRGPYDEPTRIFMAPEDRHEQAQNAAAYQARVEAAYPSAGGAAQASSGGIPYSPHQAYAPHTAGIPRPGSASTARSDPAAMAIVEASAARVVVVYPTSVQPPSPELVMVQRPDTASADQYRMLRFKLVDRPAAQVIAVTSPTRGSGTSITAANLALSLAEAGRARVVLVDANVRHSRQGDIFGIESDTGLTVELERRHANPDIAARVVAVAAAMAILPAGRDVPNPTAMLGSDVMAQLLEDLRLMYDHVVLDVAPVLDRSDAAAIHNLVDAFLLVARSSVTTTDQIEKAEEKLPRKKVAGVVLNGQPKPPKGVVRNMLHLMGSHRRRKKLLASLDKR